MQPKNSSKSSPAKAVQAKPEIQSVTNNSDIMEFKLNGKPVFLFLVGPTGNCQICTATVVEPILLEAYIAKTFKDEDAILKWFKSILNSAGRYKRMINFTFRTKHFKALKNVSTITKVVNDVDFFIDRQRYTSILMHTQRD